MVKTLYYPKPVLMSISIEIFISKKLIYEFKLSSTSDTIVSIIKRRRTLLWTTTAKRRRRSLVWSPPLSMRKLDETFHSNGLINRKYVLALRLRVLKLILYVVYVFGSLTFYSCASIQYYASFIMSVEIPGLSVYRRV